MIPQTTSGPDISHDEVQDGVFGADADAAAVDCMGMDMFVGMDVYMQAFVGRPNTFVASAFAVRDSVSPSFTGAFVVFMRVFVKKGGAVSTVVVVDVDVVVGGGG